MVGRRCWDVRSTHFVVSFLFFNLFVAALIKHFRRLKAEYSGSALLSKEQRQWQVTQQLMNRVVKARPVWPPEAEWRHEPVWVCVHTTCNYPAWVQEGMWVGFGTGSGIG